VSRWQRQSRPYFCGSRVVGVWRWKGSLRKYLPLAWPTLSCVQMSARDVQARMPSRDTRLRGFVHAASGPAQGKELDRPDSHTSLIFVQFVELINEARIDAKNRETAVTTQSWNLIPYFEVFALRT
jgi:hypothetical protein